MRLYKIFLLLFSLISISGFATCEKTDEAISSFQPVIKADACYAPGMKKNTHNKNYAFVLFLNGVEGKGKIIFHSIPGLKVHSIAFAAERSFFTNGKIQSYPSFSSIPVPPEFLFSFSFRAPPQLKVD